MPTKSTVERAKRDLARGKGASTAAGEFVREEMKHIRQGGRGPRSPRQAIAIGLSEARRAGVPLPPPRPGRASRRARKAAARDYAVGQARRKRKSAAARSTAARKAAARKVAATRSRAGKRAAANRRQRRGS